MTIYLNHHHFNCISMKQQFIMIKPSQIQLWPNVFQLRFSSVGQSWWMQCSHMRRDKTECWKEEVLKMERGREWQRKTWRGWEGVKEGISIWTGVSKRTLTGKRGCWLPPPHLSPTRSCNWLRRELEFLFRFDTLTALTSTELHYAPCAESISAAWHLMPPDAKLQLCQTSLTQLFNEAQKSTSDAVAAFPTALVKTLLGSSTWDNNPSDGPGLNCYLTGAAMRHGIDFISPADFLSTQLFRLTWGLIIIIHTSHCTQANTYYFTSRQIYAWF